LEINVENTGDYCGKYWRLMQRILEITGDYCSEYWRLL